MIGQTTFPTFYDDSRISMPMIGHHQYHFGSRKSPTILLAITNFDVQG